MTQGIRFRKIFATAASIGVLSIAAAGSARADDPSKLLKAMSDYLAGQKSLSAKFDSDIEVVTPELQKIQFSSSGEMKMNRPDKLRIRRTGGYADVELSMTARRFRCTATTRNPMRRPISPAALTR